MILLICGGSSSGKSSMAEDICQKLKQPVYYVATMKNDCAESIRKIDHHRKLRDGKGFITIEKEDCLEEINFLEKGTALIECLGNLLSNEMFKEEIDYRPNDRILREILSVAMKNENTVIVSNDIFSNTDNLNKESMAYMENLAKLNAELAKKADVVIESVLSLPNIIKGEELCSYSGIF